MAAIAKSERLLNLVSFLLKARRPVSLAEIRTSVVGYEAGAASAASVERRFERDKAALRELGIPLSFADEDEPGGPGYVIPREAYFLPHVTLSPAEAAILAATGKLAMTGAAGPVSDALDSALRKLQFDSPIPGEVRQTAEEHFLFQTTETHADPRHEQNLKEFTTAVLARRVVQFTYYTIGDDRTEQREVAPYGLGFAAGHWYLVGFDRNREDIRTFRIDRVRSEIKRLRPNRTRAEFEAPADFRIQDYVGVPPWLFRRTRRTTVRIRFSNEIAFMVRLRPAPGDAWEDKPDGSAVLTRLVSNSSALLNWVLRFGRHAEVIDPPEFRQCVAEKLQAVMARHASRTGKGGGRG
jgi:predicted DNA-binding transcriptional regulator YafY